MRLKLLSLLPLTLIGLTFMMPANAVQASDRIDCYEDCDKQYKQLKKYARNGSPQAQTLLGLAYKTGEIAGIVEPDQAWRWMKRAVRQRYAPAQFYISEWYRNGYDREANAEKAADLLQRSADQNYPPAQYQLGLIKLSEQQLEEGLALLNASAKSGDKDARVMLARLNGEPIPSDATASGITMVGPGMVTSSVEQTADDVITVMGSVEDPLFMFDTVLGQIKDLKMYDRAGTTGSRVGDLKCGQPGSACRVLKGDALQQFLLGIQ